MRSRSINIIDAFLILHLSRKVIIICQLSGFFDTLFYLTLCLVQIMWINIQKILNSVKSERKMG